MCLELLMPLINQQTNVTNVLYYPRQIVGWKIFANFQTKNARKNLKLPLKFCLMITLNALNTLAMLTM